jgi:hypothetical protein
VTRTIETGLPGKERSEIFYLCLPRRIIAKLAHFTKTSDICTLISKNYVQSLRFNGKEDGFRQQCEPLKPQNQAEILSQPPGKEILYP